MKVRRIHLYQLAIICSILKCGTSQMFTVSPRSVVQAESGELMAEFQCDLNRTIFASASIDWVLNGMNGPLPNDFFYQRETAMSPSILRIPAREMYNNTIVQCEIIQRHHTIPIVSESATLQLQEPLAAVANLTVAANPSLCSQLIISWSAPFSLNLTTADPDIQYCVDVYNVTGHYLDSVCGITDTQYTYTAPDPTGVYNFTVTPRSNIQGSLNGTTSQPPEFSYAPPPIDVMRFLANTDLNPLQVIFPKTDIVPCREPRNFSVKIQSIEPDMSAPDCSCRIISNNSEEADSEVVLKLDCQQCGIERHRQYNITLFTNGVPSQSRAISTHDVYGVTDFPMANGVEIVSEYLLNSTDRGFFVILYSENHTLYRVAYRTGNEPSTNLTLTELTNDVYRLAVYDLMNSSLGFLRPENQPVAFPNMVDLNNISVTLEPTAPSGTNSPVSHNNGSICLNCSSPGLIGCVGVIHSAPLDTYNLTVLTTRAGVEECTSERFQGELSVAVFDVGEGGLGESPSSSQTINLSDRSISPILPTELLPLCDTGKIAGIIVAIGFIVTLAVPSTIVSVYFVKKKGCCGSNNKTEEESEKKESGKEETKL